MSLEEALRLKTEELEALQQSFDEFVESSRELEAEYEKSLKDGEKELQESKRKVSSLEEKVKQVGGENAILKKENSVLQNDLASLKTKLSQLEEKRIKYETEIDSLSSQLRILEASEDDLKHKLAEAEEDIVFLHSDVEEMKASRLLIQQEYDTELAALKKALREHENHQCVAPVVPVVVEDKSALVLELQATVETLKSRVAELEEKSNIIPIESGVAEIPAERLEKIAQLEAEVNALRASQAAQQQSLRQQEEEIGRYKQLLRNRSDPDLLKLTGSNNGENVEITRVFSTEETVISEFVEDVECAKDVEFDLSSQALTFTHASVPASPAKHTAPIYRKLDHILGSHEIDVVKQEVSRLAEQYEGLKVNNTRLLSRIQAIRGNIIACCRTRPPSDQELVAGGKVCIDISDDVDVLCQDVRSQSWKSFAFDYVWKPDSTQEDVYADVEPVAVSIIDGYNACIMAYGQTGSGKTYTMDGYGEQFGVNYRTIQSLFEHLQDRKNECIARHKKANKTSVKRTGSAASINSISGKTEFEFVNPLQKKRGSVGSNATIVGEKVDIPVEDVPVGVAGMDEDRIYRYEVQMSMLEIYNEQVYDLLHDGYGGGQTDGVSLDLRQNSEGEVMVSNLKTVTVRSMDEVKQVFTRGARNRATSSTNMNEHSSRSHLIVQVEVRIEQNSGEGVTSAANGVGDEDPSTISNPTSVGKLYLVDLAGSERITKSGAVGQTMREAVHINKSLLALGDVMEALDQKNKHIPYRNSKLTFLLQNALGGSAKTMMIFTVCPTHLTYDETLFTLQFASRVRNISLGPIQATHMHTKLLEGTVKTLRTELKDLKNKKKALEDQVNELKKEGKKTYDKTVGAVETKLKASEESKKSLDAMVEKLSKQLSEINAKVVEDAEKRTELETEMDLLQRNLKKALDQVKEGQLEQERLQHVVKAKEREVETVRAALLRAYNESSIWGNGKASPSKVGSPSRDERRASSTGRLSDGSPRVMFKLDDGGEESQATPATPVHATNSPGGGIKPALKTSSMLAPAPRNPSPSPSTPSHSTRDTNIPKHFFPPSPASAGTGSSRIAEQRQAHLSTAAGTPHTRNRVPPPPSPSMPPPPALSTRSSKTVPTPSAALASTPSTRSHLLQRTGAPSSHPRPAPSSSPSPMKRKANAAPTLVSTRSSDVAGSVTSASGAGTGTGGSVAHKMPMLSARSEEALKRHQMRMEKRREALLYGNAK